MATATRLLPWWVLCTLGAFAACAAAQAFAASPVRIVAPHPAGSTSDRVARVIGEQLSRVLRQPQRIENISGHPGTAAVAGAAPDGYTLLLADSAHTAAPAADAQRDQAWHPLSSFAPVTMVGVIPSALLVQPALPVITLAELIGIARARPGTLRYASTGTGSASHLAAELFAQMAQLELAHVRFADESAALAALSSGEAALMLVSLAAAKPALRNRTARALAVSTRYRSTALPDLPAVGECCVYGYAAGAWFGYLAPAGTPQPVIQRLNDAIDKALLHPRVKRVLARLGVEPDPGPPQEFGRFLEVDLARWAEVRRARRHRDAMRRRAAG